jgi:hypothetical protein
MSKKDKKRRQKKRAGKRGVLPSSVQALLGYISAGGPAPAPQGDARIRERAGVDAYDTLHQIIKSQQLMSANYMANLERMAFQKDITDQLKKQGKENQRVLSEATQSTKDEVQKIARTYVKKSPEEKIAEYQSQIEWHLRRGESANTETIAAAEKAIKKYQGIVEFRQSSMAPAAAVAPSLQSLNVKAGGAVGRSILSVSPAVAAQAGADIRPYFKALMTDVAPPLPAQDPRAGGEATDEVQANMALMMNAPDITSSSGTPAAVGGGARRSNRGKK